MNKIVYFFLKKQNKYQHSFEKKHIQFVEKVQKTIDFQTKLFLKNIALFLEFLEHRSIPMISTYHHIKLVVLILDSKYHGHSLTNLDNTRHFTGPGAFSYKQTVDEKLHAFSRKKTINSIFFSHIYLYLFELASSIASCHPKSWLLQRLTC